METKTATEVVRVHCPQCFKPYSVNPAQIFSSRPEFKCHLCLSHFWTPFPEALEHREMVGLLMNQQPVAPEIEPALADSEVTVQIPDLQLQKMDFVEQPLHSCPKCSAQYSGAKDDCPSCGIVFKKFNQDKKPTDNITASKELKAFWEKVLADYNNEKLHERFLSQCLAEQNLTFCLSRYQNLLELNPADEIARKSKKQVMGLVDARLESKVKPKKQKGFQPGSLFILLGMSLIIFGLAFPATRNLVGVGASMIFLAIAFRAYNGQFGL